MEIVFQKSLKTKNIRIVLSVVQCLFFLTFYLQRLKAANILLLIFLMFLEENPATENISFSEYAFANYSQFRELFCHALTNIVI